MKKQNKQNKHSKKPLAYRIFNSPYSIIIVLVVLSVLLMVYNRFLINSINLYSFSAFEKDVSIFNGTIYTSYDINYFGDSKIAYTGKDIKLNTYEIGYYIKTSSSYKEIATIKSLDNKENSDLKDVNISLKEILNTTNFSFTEVSKNALFLSKNNIKNLDKLIFKISGKDDKGTDIDIEVPIEIEKVTR